MDNFDINVLENDGQVFVQDNEFSIIGDTFYSSSNYQEAPEWLLVLIDNVLTSKIAAGFTDYDLLVQDVRNAISSIDIANNTYVQQSNFTELVDGIVGSRLETLNATYEGSFATKAELDSVAAGADYALAQSISNLSATVDGQINAAVTNISTTMANNQQALASDITSISTVLDGNSAEISQTLQSINGIEASWSIDTDVNGQVAGIKLINSADAPSKFVINTDVFEVRNASTGDIVIGTENSEVVINATQVDGIPVSEVLNDITQVVTDFNTQNNRNSSVVSDPTILSNGTSIDHTINSDSSADISFEWGWAGDEGSIDGFVVLHFQSTSSSIHTFGTSPNAEIAYQMPASTRSFILRGVAADQYHTFGVIAYRKVDSDISPNGLITSNTIVPSLSSENPYRPSSSVSFSGNIVGTIDGYSASSVRSNAYAGATFTSSNAGNLAYQDLVTTTYIDNLAVNRLKIADESAGILKYATASSPVYGNGSWVQVLSLSVTTPEAASCFISVTLQQGYNINGTLDKATGFRIKRNGSIVQQRTMGAINDTPSMTSGQSLPSGTSIFTVEWMGASSDVILFSRSLTCYISLR